MSLLAYKASLIAVLMGYFWCLAGAEFDRFIGITGLYIIEFQRVWRWGRISKGRKKEKKKIWGKYDF